MRTSTLFKLSLITWLAFISIGVFVTPLFTGCKTSQQTIAYNTLYSLEKTTVAAYDGYLGQVIAGTVPTNGVPRVSAAFNKFQASALFALDAVQHSTNALAPASLVIESQSLLNLITAVSK